MKQKVVWLLGIIMMLGLSGCRENKETMIVKNLEFVVVEEERIPQELMDEVEKRKCMPFKFTFQDRGELYICIGYGEQQTGGYSITVDALDEAKNAIYVDTNLIGPSSDNKKKKGLSYPYIVIKTKDIGLPVIFD